MLKQSASNTNNVVHPVSTTEDLMLSSDESRSGSYPNSFDEMRQKNCPSPLRQLPSFDAISPKNTSSCTVLSYNINLLPNVPGIVQAPYAEERIEEFAERAKRYDIVAVQEAFASSYLPVVLQGYVCHQRMMVRKMGGNKGFPYVARCRPPSYYSILSHRCVTDAGLVIFSKHPIISSGMLTFRSGIESGDAGQAPKGILHALIRIAGMHDLLVFNVHLSSATRSTLQRTEGQKQVGHGFSSCTSTSSSSKGNAAPDPVVTEQLQELRAYVELVKEAHPGCPLIIMGNFNIDCIPLNYLSNSSAENLGTPVLPVSDSRTDLLHNIPTTPPAAAASSNISERTPEKSIEGLGNATELIQTMRRISSNMEEALYTTYGRHVTTRPPSLAFPSYLNTVSTSRFPQRTDYLFLDTADLLYMSSARLQRFVTRAQRPYMYLSDHFGISATLSLCPPVEQLQAGTSPRHSLPALGQQEHEDTSIRAFMGQSGTTPAVMSEKRIWIIELSTILILLSWAAVGFWWVRFLLVGALALVGMRNFFGNRLLFERQDENFFVVSKDVLNGKTPVALNKVQHPDIPPFINFEKDSVAELWDRAVQRYRWERCIGYERREGVPEWLTYKDVNDMVECMGLGLLDHAKPHDVVAILSDCHYLNLVVDLACYKHKIIAMPLRSRSSALRQLLDRHNVRICITTRSTTAQLYRTRTRTVQLIIQLDTPTEQEKLEALNEGFTLSGALEMLRARSRKLSHGSNLHGGNHCAADGVKNKKKSEENTPDISTLVVDNEEDANGEATAISNIEMLRLISAVFDTRLLTAADAARSVASSSFHRQRRRRSDILASSAPYAHDLNRILATAAVLSGNAVAFPRSGQFTEFRDAFMRLRPTVFVFSHAQLEQLENGFNQVRSRWFRPRRALFGLVYGFRSRIIRYEHRDSTSLNRIFFAPLARRLGTPKSVRKIIINSRFSTVAFRLRELAMVLLTPIVREAAFLGRHGFLAVDGVPPPGRFATLDAISGGDPALSSLRVVGELLLKDAEEDPWARTGVLGMWNEDTRLKLLSTADSMLWPEGGAPVFASELESMYARECPLIGDIFITCRMNEPLVAVVVPNKTVVDDVLQCQYALAGGDVGHYRSWVHFCERAEPLIKQEMRSLAVRHNLPVAQYIDTVYLHRYPLQEYTTEGFVAPNGALRRERLETYFWPRIENMRIHNNTTLSPGGNGGPTGTSQNILSPLFPSVTGEGSATRIEPRCCIAIDVGGTLAKVAFFKPPSCPLLPEYCTRENFGSDGSFLRAVNIFVNDSRGDVDGVESGDKSSIGQLELVTCASADIPRLLKFLKENHFLERFRPQCTSEIAATGGGAVKLSEVVYSSLGVRLRQVKEMDSIVAGLNFIVANAPHLIFTVNSAERRVPLPISRMYPYILVNIGSGVSIIRCDTPGGDYRRITGSPIGGGTFWGLVRTMTNIQSWEDVRELTTNDGPGDNANVDLLVGDIYGYNANALPALLSPETIASIFGKMASDRYTARVTSSNVNYDEGIAERVTSISPNTAVQPTQRPSPRPIDVVRSLLIMISYNVTQIASLVATKELVNTVFFTGGFIHNNDLVYSIIAQAMEYWSQDTLKALFVQPDGYIGTIGELTNDYLKIYP